MADEPTTKPGLGGWAKTIIGLIGLLGVGGASTGIGGFVKSDTDKQELDKRLAIVEVMVGTLGDLSKRTDSQLSAGLSKQEATTALVLGKLDLLVSKVDGLVPTVDDQKQRYRDLNDRLDRLSTDSKEARRDLRSDMSERMDDLATRIANIERRLLRATGSATGPLRDPPQPGPIIDGDAAPWITPGDPSRPHR